MSETNYDAHRGVKYGALFENASEMSKSHYQTIVC